MGGQSDAFDVIPYEDIKGDWKKLGSGSFGNVYKGTYLGIEVAIKEVLPSTDYDVSKYFEREWRLMKETRHPNAVLFIGLSRSPPPTNTIYIISEFIDNGNLRMYIHNTHKPFPWILRISFATDIARALAYLHARNCIHRDLKGENLLVTSNGRIKITDFGFARIAARNEEESKRLTFCGTDSYMSPEILVGDEFDLPTDIFSLGIIYCEILGRTLADDYHFKRVAPGFCIDEDEVRRLGDSGGCPRDFVDLTLECCRVDPKERPTTREILVRLRVIEMEVLARRDDDAGGGGGGDEDNNANIGTIKLMNTGTTFKRSVSAPRIPSFGMGVGKDIRSSSSSSSSIVAGTATDDSSDEEELMEAISTMNKQRLGSKFSDIGNEPLLLPRDREREEDGYSTSVVRSQKEGVSTPALSSILTLRPEHHHSPSQPIVSGAGGVDPLGNNSSILSIDSLDSYHTARGGGGGTMSSLSTAYATEGGSTMTTTRSLYGNYAPPLVHRFSLIKPGAKPKLLKNGAGRGGTTLAFASPSSSGNGNGTTTTTGSSWNPLDLFFPSGLLISKCDICSKRLGWKPILECDDCGMRAHLKCGDRAPHDCGLRPSRRGVLLEDPGVAAAAAGGRKA